MTAPDATERDLTRQELELPNSVPLARLREPAWAQAPELVLALPQVPRAWVRSLGCGSLGCRSLGSRGWSRLLLLCWLGLLGGFFRRHGLGLFGGFLRRLLHLFRRFLRSFLRSIFFDVFLADFFFAVTSFFLLFLFFLLFFFPLAIVVLLLPLIHVHRAFKSSAFARGQSISSILAENRLSPNREAQSCEPQELTYHRQSAPCTRYCPQQSCPA